MLQLAGIMCYLTHIGQILSRLLKGLNGYICKKAKNWLFSSPAQKIALQLNGLRHSTEILDSGSHNNYLNGSVIFKQLYYEMKIDHFKPEPCFRPYTLL